MEWNKISELPNKVGYYQCYFQESTEYKEHRKELWFDGENFRDGDSLRFWTDTRMYGGKITKWISHWMKIESPIN